MPDSVVSSILRWLRAGYPEGVPPKDYYPLLALLRDTLSREEFEEVITRIESLDADPIRVRDIRAAIEHVTSERPGDGGGGQRVQRGDAGRRAGDLGQLGETGLGPRGHRGRRGGAGGSDAQR